MTGTAETEAGELWNIYKLDVVVIPTNRPISRNDMNDRIYKTKREKYAAVIDEISSLVAQGRPVLVGTTSVEISELLSRMLNLRKIKHNVLNAKLHQREADIVAFAGQTGTVTIATNMAGRGTDIKLSPEVKAAGGLAIIGTERHESRRVDRQLRGRAGRQGDPGSSVFFVSLEDNLMRLFASDRIAGMMDKLGFKEGEVLEHSMLNKSVERAQKKVEENNFGIRKRLLEYDDVMNKQREVIYTRRRHALMGERIELDVMNTLYDGIRTITEESHDAQDYEGLEMELLKTFAMEAPFEPEEFKSGKSDNLVEKAFDTALQLFKERMERIAQVAHPVIEQVYEQHKSTPDARMMVPITDGRRVYNVPTTLKEAHDSGSKSIVKSFEKAVSLLTLDDAWKEHLRAMEELRQSVQNASYENKDPLLIYKLESYTLFRDMVDGMNRKAISILMRGQIPVREPENIREAAPERKQDYSRYRTGRSDGSEPQRGYNDPSARPKAEPVRVEKRVGRNDPCPCGSGKKFKNCHGQGA
jgi:preprotein translocase subunit SecA